MHDHDVAAPAGADAAADDGRGLSPLVRAWFVLDAIVALAPPLYWAADGRTTPILGVPAALFYFLAVGACITASLVFASWQDRASEESRA